MIVEGGSGLRQSLSLSGRRSCSRMYLRMRRQTESSLSGVEYSFVVGGGEHV